MGKLKTSSEREKEPSLETIRRNLKKSNKLITKDGMVKKKAAKLFTPFQCKVCKKTLLNKYSLSIHELIHLDMEYPCTTCSYVGRTKKYLSRHIRSKHTAPQRTCHMCGKAFHHPSALKEHIMVHTGEKPLECDVCGKRFRAKYCLNMHMHIHNNEKPFKCSFCEYACRDSSTLRKHEHRHMGIVKMFPCKICPKKFQSKGKLKYHINEVHLDYLELDLKKHKCEHCGKAFKRKATMISHMEYAHDESQALPCPVCGMSLKHKRYLKAHLRKHFPQRPFACAHNGCGKTFKEKGDLKKHSVIHTPHLHHACTKCGATFSRAYRLVNHMSTHEPREKSVICDYCDVAFYTKNYLIKHISQKHCDNKQHYICDYCGLVTYNKPSIVMHIKYGQCRGEELYCKICFKKKDSFKIWYKNMYTLRNHYLKTHKMKYKPRKNKKKKERKLSVTVKVEPVDADPYEDVQVSLLDVSKEEIEIDEEVNVENDLAYSNQVLSEDLQEYLLKDEDGEAAEPDSFDKFLLQHVFHRRVKDEFEDQNFEETDKQQEADVTQKIKDIIQKAKEDKANKILERQKRKQARILERKLKREAKMLRRKKRREKYELERVRLKYNEIMKKAVAKKSNKEPVKKITYFKNKTVDKVNSGNAIDITDDSINKDSNANKINISSEAVDIFINSEQISDDIIRNFEIGPNKSVNGENGDKGGSINDLENYNSNDVHIGNPSPSDIEINANKEKGESSDHNVETEVENFKTDDMECNGIKDKHNCINDDEIRVSCIKNTPNNAIDTKEGECMINKQMATANKDNNDERNSTSYIQHNTNDTYCVNDNANKTPDDNSIDDSPNDEESDSNSDYEPNSENESTQNKKMKFRTYQCYICFKLFPTKEEQLSHCQIHFDICNSTTLTKCPACGFVVNRNMEKHMKKKHGINIKISHLRVLRRDDEHGSKYCYKVDDTVMEIIPSVKILNHHAAVEIDKKNREKKDKAVAKAKLVKKGDQWILEKVNIDISFQELPEFTEQELRSLPVSDNYTERLGHISKLARSKGIRMMFPCDQCDKICQNYAALRLHGRRHDPNKKPFTPKKYKRNCKPAPAAKEKPKVTNLEHRVSKPQPIKNKHKCDEKLKIFYQTHIRGADIEFWQFLKIYNKMDRENIQDFEDLEGRVDFGIHTNEQRINNVPKTDYDLGIEFKAGNTSKKYNVTKELPHQNISMASKHKMSVSEIAQQGHSNVKIKKTIANQTTPLQGKNIAVKSQKIVSKLSKHTEVKKPAYKRVIMISRKEHLEREKAKMMMREKLKNNLET